jgi:hypothetical protein
MVAVAAESERGRCRIHGASLQLCVSACRNGYQRIRCRTRLSFQLVDVRSQIARALDPTVQASAAQPRATTNLDDALFDPSVAQELCWTDYSIRIKK